MRADKADKAHKAAIADKTDKPDKADKDAVFTRVWGPGFACFVRFVWACGLDLPDLSFV